MPSAWAPTSRRTAVCSLRSPGSEKEKTPSATSSYSISLASRWSRMTWRASLIAPFSAHRRRQLDPGSRVDVERVLGGALPGELPGLLERAGLEPQPQVVVQIGRAHV